jgi:hypothetical protein
VHLAKARRRGGLVLCDPMVVSVICGQPLRGVFRPLDDPVPRVHCTMNTGVKGGGERFSRTMKADPRWARD